MNSNFFKNLKDLKEIPPPEGWFKCKACKEVFPMQYVFGYETTLGDWYCPPCSKKLHIEDQGL